MRVISGSQRGKKLTSPPDLKVRPTLDRIKESIFNMIAFSVSDSVVLDLFAGSGGLGIEALSRGAQKCIFVDKSEESLYVTKENLRLTSFDSKADCVNSDFSHFLENTKEAFDLIFLDPPYAEGLMDKALELIHKNNLLRKDGFIICETDGDINYIPDETLFNIYRNKRYGRVQIFLLRNL